MQKHSVVWGERRRWNVQNKKGWMMQFFFYLVPACLFRRNGKNRSLILFLSDFVFGKSIVLCNRCWGENWNYAGTDVWETDLCIDTHLFFCLSSAHSHTNTHNHTPAAAAAARLSSLLPPPLPPPPLTYFPALGMRWWDSGLNEKWQQYLPFIPASLPHLLHLCLSPFCSAALQTLQTQSSQQAPLSASGLLVCEYANTECVCAYIWILSGCVWIWRKKKKNVCRCDSVPAHTHDAVCLLQ